LFAPADACVARHTVQVGGRALGEVCHAYPERLLRCLVVGAPTWFNILYRLIRPQLSPSTSAKVQVGGWAGVAVVSASSAAHGLAPTQ
jgi:hypothetical protein